MGDANRAIEDYRFEGTWEWMPILAVILVILLTGIISIGGILSLLQKNDTSAPQPTVVKQESLQPEEIDVGRAVEKKAIITDDQSLQSDIAGIKSRENVPFFKENPVKDPTGEVPQKVVTESLSETEKETLLVVSENSQAIDPDSSSLSEEKGAIKEKAEEQDASIKNFSDAVEGDESTGEQVSVELVVAEVEKAADEEQSEGDPNGQSNLSRKTYTVQVGDSLGSIAQKVTGKSSRWKEIYDLNPNVLSAPNALKAGMVLNVDLTVERIDHVSPGSENTAYLHKEEGKSEEVTGRASPVSSEHKDVGEDEIAFEKAGDLQGKESSEAKIDAQEREREDFLADGQASVIAELLPDTMKDIAVEEHIESVEGKGNIYLEEKEQPASAADPVAVPQSMSAEKALDSEEVGEDLGSASPAHLQKENVAREEKTPAANGQVEYSRESQQIDVEVSGTTYTVQEGDSLGSIAKKLTGKSSRWEEIFAMNREILPAPHKLKVGMVLRVDFENSENSIDNNE